MQFDSRACKCGIILCKSFGLGIAVFCKLFVVLSCVSILIPDLSALKIEINKGEVKPEPVAVLQFVNTDGSSSKMGIELASVIEHDLGISGLFEPIDKNNFLETPNVILNKGVNIKNWKVINARFLIYGTINNNIIKFHVIDIMTNKEIINSDVKLNTSKKRETAHMIADKIYERITNEEGYFNTKIVYVTTANKVPSKRTTKLMIIDQDGKNPTALTDGSELVISPRYSPDGKTIAYISYNEKSSGALGKSAFVYLMTVGKSGRRRLLNDGIMKELIKKNNGSAINMTYAPRFSNNGQSVVLAIIVNGKSAIYRYDMADNRLVQLTRHTSIDTSPCFSPDGSKIVFTSDRDGKEAIFVMNTDGSDQRKISQGEGKYSQPNWSPRGDLITFAKQIGGKFYIGVMKPDGTGERLIAQGFLVEAPTWASNGRYIIYTAQNGYGQPSQIVFSDLTGRYHRLIQTPGDASAPAWSPTYKAN